VAITVPALSTARFRAAAPAILLTAATIWRLVNAGVLTAVPTQADPIFYTSASRAIWHGHLPWADYSPLFCLLTAPFAAPWIGFTTAYELICATCALVLVQLCYWAASRVASPWVAAVATLPAVLIVELPGTLSVYVASGCVVAVGLIIVDRTPVRMAVTIAWFALAALIRPEFVFCAGGLTLLGLSSFREHRGWLLLPLVAMFLVFGYSRLSMSPANRFFEAFCTHYAWQQADQGFVFTPHHDFWIDCYQAMHRDFGAATTLVGVIRANPGAFAAHLRYNAGIILPQAALMLKLQIGRGTVSGWWMLFLAFAGSIPLCRVRGIGLPLAAVIVSALTVLFPWLIFRPRADYQIAFLPLAVVCIAALLSAACEQARVRNGRAMMPAETIERIGKDSPIS
jgi:hypothetical protein